MNVVTLIGSGIMMVNGTNAAIIQHLKVPGDFNTRYFVVTLLEGERETKFSNTHLGTLVELVRNHPKRLLGF